MLARKKLTIGNCEKNKIQKALSQQKSGLVCLEMAQLLLQDIIAGSGIETSESSLPVWTPAQSNYDCV